MDEYFYLHYFTKWLVEAIFLQLLFWATSWKGIKSCLFRLVYECKTLLQPFNCKMGTGLFILCKLDPRNIRDAPDTFDAFLCSCHVQFSDIC